MTHLVALFSALSGSAYGAPVKPRATLTYIGNEGFTLEVGGRTVFFDVLQTLGTAEHGDLPEAIFARMLAKERPFRRVPLVLVSHPHPDHVVPSVVVRFLARHPESTLASSAAVCSLVESERGSASIRRQLRAFSLDERRTGWLEVDGIEVRALELPHLAFELYQVPVLAHLVRIGDVRVLHVGDAELPPERLAELRLTDEPLDAVILPYWIFTKPGGRALVDRHLRAKRIVSMRLPQGGLAEAEENIRKTFPEAVVLTRPMDSIVLE